jgi:peroxiredoxin
MRIYKTIKWIAFIVLAVSITQCGQKSEGAFSVTVNYRNLDKMIPFQNDDSLPKPGDTVPPKTTRILLEEIPFRGDMNPVILDSATLTWTGSTAQLKGTAKEESIFQVVVEKGPILLLVNDSKNINVDLDLSKRDYSYTVSGSPASSELKELVKQYSEKSVVINKAFIELDSLKNLSAPDSLMIVSTEKKNNALKNLNDYLKNFISRTTHPALSLFALGWSSRSFPQADFEKSLTEVVAKFPEHKELKNVKVTYEMQKAQMSSQQKKQETGLWVGKPAPELALPSLEGKVVSIASFRGKYVLVDFWASWCAPCRQENPNVVKAFNRFKNKNFTILGVSLDKDKAPWVEAVKNDQLGWTHISDLKYWNSKAVETYGFEGIPYNVLIDPQGTVIAENLRGFDLEKKLAEVLPK